MKIVIIMEEGKPKAEISFTPQETVKVAPVLDRWADIVQELMTNGDEQVQALVPVLLTSASQWTTEHPEMVSKIVESFVDAALKALQKSQQSAKSGASLELLLALSGLGGFRPGGSI